MKTRKIFALLLSILLIAALFNPAAVQAKSSVTTKEELAQAVAENLMKRKAEFKVKISGNADFIDDLFSDDEDEFIYTTLAMVDDPSTSDDADYLVANMDDYSFELTDNGTTLTFTATYYETLEQTEYVNKKIPGILSKLGVDSMSNYEKVKAIHDYVCGLITYSENDDLIDYSAYGGIAKKQTKCNGYALCMYKLLVEAGVPCKYIGGKAGTGRDADGHAWNIVALGDKWYNLDATWDDDESGVYYDYFLKGSRDFDEEDPEEPHVMDVTYRTGEFAKAFPIAKTAFDPDTMSDENKIIGIGSSSFASDSETVKVTAEDLIGFAYPENGFTVKKGKSCELFLFINEGMEDLIDKVTYKVTKGKKYITSIKNYGLEYDEEEGYFTYLSFKGKKKGKITIQINLKLTDGSTVSYTFKGKVK